MFVLATVSSASACSAQPDAPATQQSTSSIPESRERVERTIDSTNQRFREAIFAKSAEQMASYYGANAIVLSSTGTEVRGATAIQTMMRSIAAMQIDSLDYRPETFVTSGDLAVQTATFRMVARVAPSGARMVESGKSLVVWNRQPDGSWRILREMQSPIPGGPAHSHD